MARRSKNPGTPAPGYQPPPGYQPQPGYQSPPPGYQSPPSGYQSPPPGYQPQPGYAAGPPGYSVPPGYEIKKKKRFYKRVWFWLLVIVVAIIGIVTAAVSQVADDATNKPHTVAYEVSGTGNITKADISYYVSDGSNHSSNVSADDQALPWNKSVTVKGDLSGFVLTANTPITGASAKGTLSCSLSVDGKVVSTDRSTGSASLVTCSGSGYDGN